MAFGRYYRGRGWATRGGSYYDPHEAEPPEWDDEEEEEEESESEEEEEEEEESDELYNEVFGED